MFCSILVSMELTLSWFYMGEFRLYPDAIMPVIGTLMQLCQFCEVWFAWLGTMNSQNCIRLPINYKMLRWPLEVWYMGVYWEWVLTLQYLHPRPKKHMLSIILYWSWIAHIPWVFRIALYVVCVELMQYYS